ncbi:MAG: hypothetical protein KF729_13435 [Sandaracinaceae bacterium]|nr:hypothetical protein [Sandaracinaceae bacterium]
MKEPGRERAEGATQVTRGRQQVLAVLVTLGGSIVVVALLGGSPLPAMIVQLVVLALLGYQTMRGVGWARWVLVALTGLAALGNGYAGLESYGADGIGWIVNASLAAIYLWCAAVLVLSEAVVAFQAAARARGAAPPPAP